MRQFNKNLTLLFLLPCTLIMALVMAKTGSSLKTSATPLGIINLELAYSAVKANTVINAWSATKVPDNTDAAKINTWLDFIFLFFYSLFLYNACKLIAAGFNGVLSITGGFVAKGALLAGLCDIFENTGMLLILHGQVSDGLALFTVISSTIKWMLVFAAIIYIITGALLLVYRKLTAN